MRNSVRIGLQDEGILIRDIIKQEDTTVISRKTYIKFDKRNIDEFEEKFNELKSENILSPECSFEDNEWYGLAIDWNIHLKFGDFEYNQSLYNALKCFVITELYDRRISLTVIGLRLSEIKKTIKMTKNYKEECLEEFIRYIESRPPKALNDFKYGNTAFLYFYPINDYEDYLVELSYIPGIKVMGEDVRELPPYKSIVWFDYLISDFMSTAEVTLKRKYYPVYLWWRITTVIPLRPNEFLKLKRDCCYYNPKDNEYYIEVPRTKQRPNPLSKRRVVPIIDKLKTNKDIYDLIEDYIKLTGIGEEHFLFSLKGFDHLNDKFFKNRVIKERIIQRDFVTLLSDFYKEIIQEKYQFNVYENKGEFEYGELNFILVKLRPGDTRHMAFCTMMLQGFNPLTIAQIGGHESLYSQNHYLSHLAEFTEAHSLMLAKYIKQNINKPNDNVNDLFTSAEKRQLAFKTMDNVNSRNIDGGLCYSRNFPKECIDKDCLFCSYFRFNFADAKYSDIEQLNNSLTFIRDEIKVKIGFLKRYYEDMTKTRRNEFDAIQINESNEKELQRESKELNILVNRKAVLLAHIEKLNEID
ncbi:hypothetical protein [Fredinandcohnia quinoae]|uniref:Integrase n=1 Tax=Fredinandcohnia quinoae TaxID=2918902 RepID=A0AAW5E9P5_9BACI|nr:hypothetical protein [Fredinandcohnia sp. SECRCQ15]MCH1626126.1 hypothetical protein [Fredinandcohnia sp. SECRCQ15]